MHMAKFVIFHVVLLLVLLLLLVQTYCKPTDENCFTSPSSCGPITTISYPFRLTTDPTDCGNTSYEISCENNVPMFYYHSEKYFVRSINYSNFTIRLSDASLIPHANKSSFFCNRSLTGQYGLAFDRNGVLDYTYDGYGVVIMSCPSLLHNPEVRSGLYYYEDGAICSGGSENNSSSKSLSDSSNRYLVVSNGSIEAWKLLDSCRVELIHLTSMPIDDDNKRRNISFKDVNDSWAYGFELTWFGKVCCSKFNGEIYSRKLPRIRPVSFRDRLFWIRYRLDMSPLGTLRAYILGFHISHAVDKAGYVLLDGGEYVTTYVVYDRGLFVTMVALFSYLLLLVVLLRPLLFPIGTLFLMLLLLYKWRRRHLSIFDNIEEFLQSYENQFMPMRYSYANIKKITNCFKEKLGEGGYGLVYKGKLRSGQLAAVKMLGKDNSDDVKQFINEVATIGRIHHVNVVRLIGFCAEGSKRALVYEFMPNGSLDKYLSSTREGDGDNMPIISNKKMYEVGLGVARGIEYLHRGCEMQILHFDLKPHNILLDENFIPKISDFGLAKVYPTNKSIVSLTTKGGTLGYMAPELFYRSVGDISYKVDVYSYGRMLIEMAARKRDFNLYVDHSSQIFFPSWVHDQINQGMDVDLGDITEKEKEITKRMMIVGMWCVQLNPLDRPSMRKVVEMLEGEIECLQLPPKPAFAPPLLMQIEEDSPTGTTTQQVNVPGDEHQGYSQIIISINA